MTKFSHTASTASILCIWPNVTPPSGNSGANLGDITFSTQMPPVPCGHTLGHPVLLEILQQVSDLHKTVKSDVVYSVPGLSGVPGNEAASAAAKEPPCSEMQHQTDP